MAAAPMILLFVLVQGWAATGVASEYPYVRCLAQRTILLERSGSTPTQVIEDAEIACLHLRAASVQSMKVDFSKETRTSAAEVNEIPDEQLAKVVSEQVRQMMIQIIAERRKGK
jgi:hypothetical protein